MVAIVPHNITSSESEFPYEIPNRVKSMASDLGVSKICVHPCPTSAEVNLTTRAITINPDSPVNEALESLIFELHNLAAKNQFEALTRRISSLSVDEYVKAKEEIEYKNVRAAQKMIRELKIKSTLDTIDYDFDVHYLIQQAAGHSQMIADEYARKTNSEASYKGTWAHPIRTEAERIELFFTLVKLKNSSDFSSDFRELSHLTRTVEQIKDTKPLRKLFPKLSRLTEASNSAPLLARIWRAFQ